MKPPGADALQWGKDLSFTFVCLLSSLIWMWKVKTVSFRTRLIKLSRGVIIWMVFTDLVKVKAILYVSVKRAGKRVCSVRNCKGRDIQIIHKFKIT